MNQPGKRIDRYPSKRSREDTDGGPPLRSDCAKATLDKSNDIKGWSNDIMRVSDRPQAYQRGWVEFFKLRFKVTQDVLIPRPETELLVEWVIKANPKRVLDVGTGAGNIAVSIAKNVPGVRVVATDVSKEALVVAKQNARLHGVDDRIEFVGSDLLEGINSHPRSSRGSKVDSRIRGNDKEKGGNDRKIVLQDDSFDIIVTNLPYIPSARIDYLDSSVKDYEPRVALDGGEDGFELYRRLFRQIDSRLRGNDKEKGGNDKEKGGNDNKGKGMKGLKYLVGEIDYTQAEIAQNEANRFFPGSQPEVRLDFAHKQRLLVIKF